MEILAKKEACGILQLIRDLHFIGKLRKRASNKYNRDWEQKILNDDNENTNLLFPFMGDKVSQRNVWNASSNIGGAHWSDELFTVFAGKKMAAIRETI